MLIRSGATVHDRIASVIDTVQIVIQSSQCVVGSGKRSSELTTLSCVLDELLLACSDASNGDLVMADAGIESARLILGGE